MNTRVARPFGKLLIANRGEIARRILRSARRMGLRTVAVYSEADAGAAHVAEADEARPIGPAPARESYLNIARILEAARDTGAEAVHPGYGFLAENADFAEACVRAGLVFIGPPAATLRTLGDKSAAKALMAEAGVPLVPGYHGDDQTAEGLAAAAGEIGYPVLIKAAAGGGGKGMRVVERAADFAEALDGARREAAAAFGDSRVLVERWLARPRHIEIQVFADAHGNAVHLFERDCSLQRRHQKVIEEAPAPGLSPERRAAMAAAALAAVRASDYLGAGTVEFLVDGEAFYFMEVNARLQVEHPVTEMITGVDLVEWQIRVAAGEPLPCGQDALRVSGHAVEARIYAEDPRRDFLPSGGRLVHLRLPAEGPHVRVETGVREGETVGLHYDPMIAKLIVRDRSRAAALKRLRAALAETEVVGPASNVEFLAALAGHPAFAAGALDTGFIARERDALVPKPEPVSDEVLAIACIAELERRRASARDAARRTSDPVSPWADAAGWRVNAPAETRLRFRTGSGDALLEAAIRREPGGCRLDLPGGAHAARLVSTEGRRLTVELDGRERAATVVFDGPEVTVLCAGRSHRLHRIDPLESAPAEEAALGGMTAPMPGRVVKLPVAAGQAVARGTPLLVLEAMKMEHSILAPADGTVTALRYAVGDLVEEGAELLAFEPSR